MDGFQLAVVKQPVDVFYKDEGGKQNQLVFKVKIDGDLSKPLPDALTKLADNDGNVKLNIGLYYEDLSPVEDDDVLRYASSTEDKDMPPCISLQTRHGGVRYRLEKVSKRNDGHRFILIVSIDGLDQFRVVSSPTLVLSKRKSKSDRLPVANTPAASSMSYSPNAGAIYNLSLSSNKNTSLAKMKPDTPPPTSTNTSNPNNNNNNNSHHHHRMSAPTMNGTAAAASSSSLPMPFYRSSSSFASSLLELPPPSGDLETEVKNLRETVTDLIKSLKSVTDDMKILSSIFGQMNPENLPAELRQNIAKISEGGVEFPPVEVGSGAAQDAFNAFHNNGPSISANLDLWTSTLGSSSRSITLGLPMPPFKRDLSSSSALGGVVGNQRPMLRRDISSTSSIFQGEDVNFSSNGGTSNSNSTNNNNNNNNNNNHYNSSTAADPSSSSSNTNNGGKIGGLINSLIRAPSPAVGNVAIKKARIENNNKNNKN